jgi:hypothetical protein
LLNASVGGSIIRLADVPGDLVCPRQQKFYEFTNGIKPWPVCATLGWATQ